MVIPAIGSGYRRGCISGRRASEKFMKLLECRNGPAYHNKTNYDVLCAKLAEPEVKMLMYSSARNRVNPCLMVSPVTSGQEEGIYFFYFSSRDFGVFVTMNKFYPLQP